MVENTQPPATPTEPAPPREEPSFNFGSESLNALAAQIRAAYNSGGERAVAELLIQQQGEFGGISANVRYTSLAENANFDIGSGRAVNPHSDTDRDGAADERIEDKEVVAVFAANVIGGENVTAEERQDIAERMVPYICGCTRLPAARTDHPERL